MENIENKIPNGENQDTQNSSFFSENVSSSNGLEAKFPLLRFRKFSHPWKQEKLSNFTSRIMRKNSNNETELPLTISSKDGLVDQVTFFNKKVSSKDMSGYYLLKNGEFAYNKSYSNGYDFGSIKRLERYEMGALSTLYICFSLKKHCSDYIKHYFDSLKWYRQIYVISAEGARNHGLLNVPTDDFFATTHYLSPYMEEQQKIANFLSLVDQRIEKQRQLVESLKKYKRGLLSAIFDKISSTSTLTLGEICNITTGKLDANAMVVGGKYRFYTCAREYFEIDTYAFDTDALLISGNGANVGYIHHYCGKFNAYQRTYVLDGFQENIMYIYYYLQANLHPRIEAEKKAGNTPYIVLSTLSDMLIKLPAKERQNNIAKIFAILDKKIMVENDVLERLNTQKQGLLQQMFI